MLSSKPPWLCMMTSSNKNIFRVTGGEFIGPGKFPTQRPVTRSFDVFFDLRPNKWLSKQSWVCWFETPSRSLWRHCNGYSYLPSVVRWRHSQWPWDLRKSHDTPSAVRQRPPIHAYPINVIYIPAIYSISVFHQCFMANCPSLEGDILKCFIFL